MVDEFYLYANSINAISRSPKLQGSYMCSEFGLPLGETLQCLTKCIALLDAQNKVLRKEIEELKEKQG